MWTSLIAVMGTLAGGIVAGLIQHRSARSVQRAAHATELRRDQLAAVTALTTAVADHRRAMWMREEARTSGVPADRLTALRDASHVTRSAITAPLTAVQILIPHQDVQDAAAWAVTSTYRMRDARGPELEAARQAAVKAADRLVSVTGDRLSRQV